MKKRIISLLLAVILLFSVLPLAEVAAEECDLTLTVTGIKKPISNALPEFNVSIKTAGFSAFGYGWVDDSGRFGNFSSESMESVYSLLSEGAVTNTFSAFADAQKYSFLGLLLYNGSENYSIESEVDFQFTTANGEVLSCEGGYIPVSYLKMYLPSTVTLPTELKTCKGIISFSTNFFIASPLDHEHDDDTYQYDETYHWSCCSVCGVQTQERSTHYIPGGGEYTTWSKDAATSTTAGRYYLTCSSCNHVIKEYTIPKQSEQVVVKNYPELVQAVAKGGTQYILCDFKSGGNYIYPNSTYFFTDASKSAIVLDDPDADIFIDTNGYRISYETTRITHLIDVKAGKLTVFNKDSFFIRGNDTYNLYVSAINLNEGILVEENGELDLVNMSINAVARNWHEFPDVVSYGKLNIYGGFFQSSRLGETGFYADLAAVIIHDGEAKINAAEIVGYSNGLFIGADSDTRHPFVTINRGTITGTVAVYQGKNANLIINNCDTEDSTAYNTNTYQGLVKANYSGTLIINNCSLRGHRTALNIEDTTGNVSINGGSFRLISSNSASVNASYGYAAILLRPNAENVTISEADIYGAPGIAFLNAKNHPATSLQNYVSKYSSIMVDYKPFTDFDTPVASLGEERVAISSFPLTGDIKYTSSIAYNTPTSLAYSGDVAKVDASKRHVQWQYDNNGQWVSISGATSPVYTFTDSSVIGKDVRVVVTADGFTGTLTSTPVKLEKKSNLYTAVEKPDAALMTSTSFKINNYSSNQEYLVLDRQVSTSSLTDSDWEAAVTRRLFSGLTADKTYYIYTRYKETDTTTAGKIVACSSIQMATNVYCQYVLLGDYANNATIYIEKGKAVSLPVSYTPANANTGNQYKFSASSSGFSISGVGVSSYASIGTTGNLYLVGSSVGNYYLRAQYTTNVINEYSSWTIVVYDPNDVQMYQMSATKPFADVVIAKGETYKVPTPEYYPCPTDKNKYKTVCYLEKTTMTGMTRYYENDYISINPTTGLITAKAKTTSPIKVCVALTDGSSFSSKGYFEISVLSSRVVALESFELNHKNLSMVYGEIEQLTASLTPYNATVPNANYSSSNEKVAIIGSDGIVKAVGAGTAQITVTIGSLSKQCNVTVSENVGAFYGDVNQDKEIDVVDFLCLKKYLATGKNKIDLVAADVNGDGAVDSKDLIALRIMILNS